MPPMLENGEDLLRNLARQYEQWKKFLPEVNWNQSCNGRPILSSNEEPAVH